MPALIERLRTEHELIRSGLALLLAMADQVQRSGELPADGFRKLLAFFMEYADGLHHNAEAQALYPLVASEDDEAAAAAGNLLHDHGETREALHALALYRRCRQLDDADELRAFVTACRTYAARLGHHMADEEAGIFCIADRLGVATEDDEPMPATADWREQLQQLASDLGIR